MKMFIVSFLSVFSLFLSVLADPPPPVSQKRFVSWKEYREGTSPTVNKMETVSETVASFVAPADTSPCQDCGGVTNVQGAIRPGTVSSITAVRESYKYEQPAISGEPSKRTPVESWPGGANDFERSRAVTLARQFSGEYGCVPAMPCNDQLAASREYGYAARNYGYGRGYRYPFQGNDGYGYSRSHYPRYGYGYGYSHSPGVFYGRDWGTGRAYVVPFGVHRERRSFLGISYDAYVRSGLYGRSYGY